jgi:nitrate/nitrite-specific signal transduction histidine kinase
MNADIGAFRKGKIDARVSQIADRTRALQTNIVLFVVMTLLIAMVLLLGFAHFTRLAISIPLNNLREGTREFSRGNLDYRLPVQGTDEIALIAGQMNGMADSLKLSLRVLEDKLSESTNALAAARRTEIAIRHEINNPLTNVIGNVELLMDRYEHKDKDLTARLEVVLNSSLRIAEITRRLQEIKRENDRRTNVKTTD